MARVATLLLLLLAGCAIATGYPAPASVPEPYPVATQAVRPPVAADVEILHHVWLPIAAASGAWRGVGVTNMAAWNAGDHALIPDSMWRYKWWFGVGDLGVNQVPLLKERSDHNAAMRYYAERGYCGPLLFLNEPELKNQGDLSPALAADWYGQIVAARPCLDVIAGGVIWTRASGRAWLEQFRVELVQRGLPMPAGWHIHEYSFIDGLQANPVWGVRGARAWMDAHGLAGELWLTEFAWCRSDVDSATVAGWLRDLDAEPGLQRYALFATRRTDEFHRCGAWWMVDDAGLTDVGRLYFLR